MSKNFTSLLSSISSKINIESDSELFNLANSSSVYIYFIYKIDLNFISFINGCLIIFIDDLKLFNGCSKRTYIIGGIELIAENKNNALI